MRRPLCSGGPRLVSLQSESDLFRGRLLGCFHGWTGAPHLARASRFRHHQNARSQSARPRSPFSFLRDSSLAKELPASGRHRDAQWLPQQSLNRPTSLKRARSTASPESLGMGGREKCALPSQGSGRRTKKPDYEAHKIAKSPYGAIFWPHVEPLGPSCVNRSKPLWQGISPL